MDTQDKKSEGHSREFTLFLILWMGDFISTIGSGLTAFVLSVYAFKTTGEATSAAMMVFFAFLPAFVLRPIGGILADKLDRFTLMLLGNLGSAVGIVLVLLFISNDHPNFTWVYFGVAFSSMFVALQNPAYKASVSDFLPPDLYTKASGLLQLSSSAQFLIAPLVGGILMSMMRIQYALVIDIASFIVSVLAILFVKASSNISFKRQKSHVKTNVMTELQEGFRAISQNRGISMLVGLTSLLLFYIGLIQALLGPMVLSFTSAKTLGIVQSTAAIGMLISAILISTLQRKMSHFRVLIISLGLMGLFFSLIGITANVWAVFFPCFLFMLTVPYANSCIDVLIRQNISNHQQGRVWSLISVFTYIGSLIAYLVAGPLADKIFNPLLMPDGRLAASLGPIFGVGPGRGIALMFAVSGLLVIALAALMSRSVPIQALEKSDAVNSAADFTLATEYQTEALS